MLSYSHVSEVPKRSILSETVVVKGFAPVLLSKYVGLGTQYSLLLRLSSWQQFNTATALYLYVMERGNPQKKVTGYIFCKQTLNFPLGKSSRLDMGPSASSLSHPPKNQTSQVGTEI